MARLDALDGWEWLASGGGLDPWDGTRWPCLQRCAVGPQSPTPHPLWFLFLAASVSWALTIGSPVITWGTSPPPSSALPWEKPHTHRDPAHAGISDCSLWQLHALL